MLRYLSLGLTFESFKELGVLNLNGVEFVLTLASGSNIIVISLVRRCSFVNAAATESKRDHK
jgi:hypothetical protein